jgi:hypothetical protein
MLFVDVLSMLTNSPARSAPWPSLQNLNKYSNYPLLRPQKSDRFPVTSMQLAVVAVVAMIVALRVVLDLDAVDAVTPCRDRSALTIVHLKQ